MGALSCLLLPGPLLSPQNKALTSDRTATSFQLPTHLYIVTIKALLSSITKRGEIHQQAAHPFSTSSMPKIHSYATVTTGVSGHPRRALPPS